MPPFIRREASAGPASGGRNINKPSRRVTKDDISGPTLLPHGVSQSLPSSTSILNDAMKGHKRGKSEPFPTGRRGWASFLGGLRSPGIKKLVISSAYNSKDNANSILSRQMGSQSIQITFPQVKKDKSLPVTPHLDHLPLRAVEFPDITTSILESGTSPGNQPETILSPLFFPTMGHLVGQDDADYVLTQFAVLTENEDAGDMYANTMSIFQGLSIKDDAKLEPALDDKSMARPTSVITAKSTTYSLIIGDDSTAYDTAPEDGDPGTMSVPYVPPEGTFLARISKNLDDAEIPYIIRKAESVITYASLLEEDDELEARNRGSMPDVPRDIVLQVYRHGLEDFEEELLAREIIFTRGSDYFHHRHAPQSNGEGARPPLRRRNGHLFPSWYEHTLHSKFSGPEGDVEALPDAASQEPSGPECIIETPLDAAQQELSGHECAIEALLDVVRQELGNSNAHDEDSDDSRPPSEY